MVVNRHGVERIEYYKNVIGILYYNSVQFSSFIFSETYFYQMSEK